MKYVTSPSFLPGFLSTLAYLKTFSNANVAAAMQISGVHLTMTLFKIDFYICL
jgi:hypothetical protein